MVIVVDAALPLLIEISMNITVYAHVRFTKSTQYQIRFTVSCSRFTLEHVHLHVQLSLLCHYIHKNL